MAGRHQARRSGVSVAIVYLIVYAIDRADRWRRLMFLIFLLLLLVVAAGAVLWLFDIGRLQAATHAFNSGG